MDELPVVRIMVVILCRFLHPMLAFRGDSPVSPTIRPRFCRGSYLFSGDGNILVLQPIDDNGVITGCLRGDNGVKTGM